MTRDDIIRLAREAGWKPLGEDPKTEFTFFLDNLERFAALVAAPLEQEIKRLRFCIPEGDAAAAMEYLAYCVEKAVAAERERMDLNAIHTCHAECQNPFCVRVREAVAHEREQCAKLCEEMARRHDDIRRAALEVVAEWIRARSNTGIKWEIEP